MIVLELVCSVIMMCPYQNWSVTVLVSLYMEWKEGCAPNLLEVVFHGTQACEKCPDRSDQSWFSPRCSRGMVYPLWQINLVCKNGTRIGTSCPAPQMLPCTVLM